MSKLNNLFRNEKKTNKNERKKKKKISFGRYERAGKSNKNLFLPKKLDEIRS